MLPNYKNLVLTLLFITIVPSIAWAQPSDGSLGNIENQITQIFSQTLGLLPTIMFAPIPGSESLLGVGFPWIVFWLGSAGVILTLNFGFIQIRGFKHAIELVRGDYNNQKHPGEISHFQALSTALAATVGLGNIAGVAVALSIGGPGATFWMILVGLLGMCTKFVECTLGVKYRQNNPDGSVSGGPMYYLSKGLAEKGWEKTGKFLAIFFAVCCVLGSFGIGNMAQSNQTRAMLYYAFPSLQILPNWGFGLILATVVGMVILGGIRSIANVTDKMVPFMAGLYILSSIAVLAYHFEHIPNAIMQIIQGAFAPTSIAGGIVGVLIQGMKRATFSNEAGIGSAPIAHSAAKTKEPISEGHVALLEPFIDTVIICTMTALVLLVSGVLGTAPGDVRLTSAAFETLHPAMRYVISIVVVLFAVSTIIGWSYYGLKAWNYMLGEGKWQSITFQCIYCGFTVIGCVLQLNAVIDFTDAAVFAMSIANIIGLYWLMDVVKRELSLYNAKRRSGVIRKSVR